MNSRKIGKIVSIRNNNIIGEIYPNIRNYINTLDETLFVGEIGSYVSIYNFDKIIIAEIVAIDATTDINEKNYNKPQETKKVILNLVGELQEKENSNKNNDNKDYSFTFGVSRMPLIFSDIYITSKDEIDGIFNITNENEYLELGTSIINDNYEVKADINNLFGSHFAVLGNTGAGKSNTIASIIQKIFNTKNNADNTNNATFIFIDSNGEYADAWSELSNNNVKVIQYKVPDDLVNNKSNPDEDKYEDEKDANSSTTKQENSINSNSQNSSENMNKINSQEHNNNTVNNIQENENNITNSKNNIETKELEIPVWALSADDWAVLLQATEKTQLPVLYRAIEFAKIFYSEKEILLNTKKDKENLQKKFNINCRKNNTSIQQNDTDSSSNNNDNKNKIRIQIHNYIIAKIILKTLSSADNATTKSEKILHILSEFCTNEINGHHDFKINDILVNNKIKVKATMYNVFTVDYGNLLLYKDDNTTSTVLNYLEQFTAKNLLYDYTIQDEVVKYNIEEFKEMLELAIMYEGSLNSSRIYEYTSTLLIRLDAFINSNQSKVFTKTEYNTTSAYIKKFITDKNIINIDLSNLDDLSAEIIVKVLSKILLEYLKSLENRASKPINLIVEEAHRYIRNENQYGALNYNIFDRIAKEGRKYGFLMGVSSQRPSDLSKTVLSQCSNFIIHRIQNPEDLHYIAKMVPFINDNMLSQITYIQTGLALVFGSAVNVPIIAKFDKAKPATNSHNADIMKCWYGNDK